MACMPCWQQRQLLMNAWHQRNPYALWQAATQGVHIASDKYIRGIDVTRKYGGILAQDPRQSRTGHRVR